MSNDFVTIFTITYNCEKHILKCYNSILKQSYKNWNWLIIDDGSDDDTESTIKKINNEKIFYHKLSNNSGRGKARNYGLQKIKTKYTAILDMDDTMDADRLLKSIKLIKEKNVDLVFSSINIINENHEIINIRRSLYSKFPKLYTHATLFIKSNLLKKIKYCNSKYAEDFILVLKSLKYPYAIIESPLYNYFESGSINLNGAYLSNYHLLNNLKSYYNDSTDKLVIVYLIITTFIKKSLLYFILKLNFNSSIYNYFIKLRKN